MIIPQLWVGRMRRDAADSFAYGCTGVMGIHWRTRILGPNVSALAKAAWDQKDWNPDFGKPYRSGVDKPRDLPAIKSPGNRERFDYWLNNFRYIRAAGHVNCTWARFNEAIKKVKAEKDDRAKKKLAEELAKILGRDLPADAMGSKEYTGPVRIFVPTARTSISAGEELKLKVILLGAKAKHPVVYYRPMGAGKFSRKTLGHLGRGVYSAALPADAIASDTEYYVQIITDSDEKLQFPATAPAINQTVLVGL